MKITDKQRLAIFKLGFVLKTYEGKWWIARPECDRPDTLMIGINTEADLSNRKEGYFSTAERAIDSFIRVYRRRNRAAKEGK